MPIQQLHSARTRTGRSNSDHLLHYYDLAAFLAYHTTVTKVMHALNITNTDDILEIAAKGWEEIGEEGREEWYREGRTGVSAGASGSGTGSGTSAQTPTATEALATLEDMADQSDVALDSGSNEATDKVLAIVYYIAAFVAEK